ncbi:MAG: hypothetical protein GOV00_04160 [Candidatus Altiarchaeota archaeon]|nr:hypothetical protein [Candidatus Altiarchaeota archaeon]
MALFDMLKFIGTVSLFLISVFVIFTLLSRIKTDDVKSVSDVLKTARGGVASSLVVSPSLAFDVSSYICGAQSCTAAGVKITNTSVRELEVGKMYVISAEKCDDVICVEVSEGGNIG